MTPDALEDEYPIPKEDLRLLREAAFIGIVPGLPSDKGGSKNTQQAWFEEFCATYRALLYDQGNPDLAHNFALSRMNDARGVSLILMGIDIDELDIFGCRVLYEISCQDIGKSEFNTMLKCVAFTATPGPIIPPGVQVKLNDYVSAATSVGMRHDVRENIFVVKLENIQISNPENLDLFAVLRNEGWVGYP